MANTWTSRTSGFGADTITCCVYGINLFCVGGASGKLATSSDGITWTLQTSSFGATTIRGVGTSGALFVAVGDSGKLATSSDGAAWTQQTSSFGTTSIQGVAYGGALWVAVGSGGKLATSSDGITWTQRTSSFGTSTIYTVTYDGAQFVAAGQSGKIATSPDGITWTQRTGSVGTSLINSSAAAGGLIVVSTSIAEVSTSTDGITWVTQTDAINGTVSMGGVGCGGGWYIQVGYDYSAAISKVGSSQDGTTWAADTITGTSSLNAVCYGAGMFVAVGGGGGLFTTSPPLVVTLDGITSGEAFGAATAAGYYLFVALSSVTSAEAFGAAGITHHSSVVLTSGTSAEAFGALHSVVTVAVMDTLQAGSSGGVVHPVADEWADSISLLQADTYSMLVLSTLTQNLLLSDRVGFYAEQLIQDALTLTLIPVVAAEFPVTLLDGLEVHPTGFGALTFILSEGDTVSLQDALRAALVFILQDSLTLSDSLTSNLRLALGLADTAALAATPYDTITAQITLQDTAGVSDSAAETLNLYLTLRDGAILEVLAEQDDATYLCLALNTALGGATTYEAYNFSHMAQFRGHTLLGNAQGLYEVTGADDAGSPFHATFATGLLDFGDPRAKRLQALYVGHDSQGETFIGTLAGNDRTARWYRLSPTDGGFQTERASPALGVAARYWAIEVDSTAAFEIESIELRPVVTGRRKGG